MKTAVGREIKLLTFALAALPLLPRLASAREVVERIARDASSLLGLA